MRKTTAILAGAAAAAIGLFAGKVSAHRPAPPPSAVAFVNLNRVYEQYASVRSVEKDLNAELEMLKTRWAERERELKEAQNNLTAQMEPGTPGYDKERKRIELGRRELEIDQIQGTENLRRKEVRGMARVYREVVAEAERLAQERGFTAVLNVDGQPIQVEEKGQVINRTDLKLQMALRTVLWSAPEVDLTDAILEALNARAPKEPEPPK